MLLNPESLADSSQFEKLAPSIQSNDSKELVKAMDGEYNSNISLKSNNSSLLQPKMNTQIIKVNEGSQLSINEKKELEELREKIKLLNKENTKLKKQLFITRKFLKYFLIKYKDDILTKNEPIQNSINLNDSINSFFNQSYNDLNKSVSLNQNRINIKRSGSSQINFNILSRPNSQTIVTNKTSKTEIINKLFNSMIKNNMKNKKEKSKINAKDILKNKIEEENRKKLEDKYASSLALKKFRKKYNIPKNITDTEIKIEIMNKKYNYEEASKLLLEKASEIKK